MCGVIHGLVPVHLSLAPLPLGREAGEFEVDDPDFTAEMIQAATLKFSYPQLFSRLSLEKLERELDGVYQLIVRGLVRSATA